MAKGSLRDDVQIKITPFGDWGKVFLNVAALPSNIKKSALNTQDWALRRLVKIVKNHILRQDLSVFHQYPKKRPNNDPRVLIDTQAYISSITVWQQGQMKHAGVRAGLTEPSGQEITLVAAWLEHGTEKMPARPVWGPSIEELGGERAISKDTIKRLKLKFRQRGWEVY